MALIILDLNYIPDPQLFLGFDFRTSPRSLQEIVQILCPAPLCSSPWILCRHTTRHRLSFGLEKLLSFIAHPPFFNACETKLVQSFSNVSYLGIVLHCPFTCILSSLIAVVIGAILSRSQLRTKRKRWRMLCIGWSSSGSFTSHDFLVARSKLYQNKRSKNTVATTSSKSFPAKTLASPTPQPSAGSFRLSPH